MKKFIFGLIIGLILATAAVSLADYYWDTRVIAGGINGTQGIPLKVDSTGAVYIR